MSKDNYVYFKLHPILYVLGNNCGTIFLCDSVIIFGYLNYLIIIFL